MKTFHVILVFGLLTFLEPSEAQLMKCSYGERGSLTATCVNATTNYFRSTSYRFDSLDETVRCVNCNLETIESNSFDISGNQILTLDLKDSRIATLKDSSFVGLIFLKTLYLQDNGIRNIFPGIFRGIKKLENLQLANNSISILNAYGFKELVNLTDLHLEYNTIKTIDDHAFDGLASLARLFLSHNQITSVGNVFSVLPRVQTIDLSFNEVGTVKAGDLENMTSVLEFNLEHNKLKMLQPNSFSCLQNVEKLTLSSNDINFVHANALSGLNKLEYLYLGNNSVSIINKGTFLGLTELRELDISNNSLRYFKTGLFSGLPEMRYLNLSSNMILQVQRTGIMNLLNLHTLDLSHNNLTDLDYKILYHHMPRITYLGLNGNTWPCYLVTEMDEYFKDDNIKLSVDGILRNNTCTKVRKVDNEAIQSELVLDDGPSTSYAAAYIVYPLMVLMVISNAVLFYLLYRTDKNAKHFSGTNSASRANLMSSELQANDNVDY